jgi:hypothetical protein
MATVLSGAVAFFLQKCCYKWPSRKRLVLDATILITFISKNGETNSLKSQFFLNFYKKKYTFYKIRKPGPPPPPPIKAVSIRSKQNQLRSSSTTYVPELTVPLVDDEITAFKSRTNDLGSRTTKKRFCWFTTSRSLCWSRTNELRSVHGRPIFKSPLFSPALTAQFVTRGLVIAVKVLNSYL